MHKYASVAEGERTDICSNLHNTIRELILEILLVKPSIWRSETCSSAVHSFQFCKIKRIHGHTVLAEGLLMSKTTQKNDLFPRAGSNDMVGNSCSFLMLPTFNIQQHSLDGQFAQSTNPKNAKSRQSSVPFKALDPQTG